MESRLSFVLLVRQVPCPLAWLYHREGLETPECKAIAVSVQLCVMSSYTKKQTRSSRSVNGVKRTLFAITVWQVGHQRGFGLRGGDTVYEESINQLKSPYGSLGLLVENIRCVQLVLVR